MCFRLPSGSERRKVATTHDDYDERLREIPAGGIGKTSPATKPPGTYAVERSAGYNYADAVL